MKKNAPTILQRRQQRKARHTANRQAQERLRRLSDTPKSRGEALVCELFKTIHHFFPDLFDQLRQMEDCRGKSDYTLAEIVLAGIALFLFQQGSRNALNNNVRKGDLGSITSGCSSYGYRTWTRYTGCYVGWPRTNWNSLSRGW